MSTYLTGLLFLGVLFIDSTAGSTSDRREKSINNELKFATSSHVFRENMPIVSMRSDLLKFDRVQSDSVHEVVFVIRQRNMEELTRILHDISDPDSDNYGMHLTREKVISMTINSESRDAVLSHLASIGSAVKSVTPGGEFIIAEAPVAVWEDLFKAEFFTFQQTLPNGQTHEVVRSDAYSIPSALHAHVQSVLNIVEIPNGDRASFLTPVSRNKFAPLISKNVVTPAKLRKYYNMSTSRGSDKSTQAIFAAIQQNFSPADLRTFQRTQNLELLTATSIGGHTSDYLCTVDTSTCAESNLDMQYIMSTSPGSPTIHWYSDLGFTSWLVDVAQASVLPLVLSISYGQEERFVTKATLDAFNTAAIKLSSMGVTIFVASGDDGANSRSVRTGLTGNCGYQPDFPSGSPYLTVVGATSGVEFLSTSVEVAAQGDKVGQTITSGGGFSNYYPQLTWQSSAVSGYFSAVAAINQKPVSGYRASGRAYPDISLAGINYVVVIGGISYDVSGTSASCPAVAGFFSNINAARIKLGKGSLGWLNPTLYTKGSSFINDITSGDNYCVADGTCCSTGFYATKGWDPATGLGSVNYGKMATLFVSLGQIVFVAEPSSSEASSGKSGSNILGIVVGTVVGFFVILTIALSVIFCRKAPPRDAPSAPPPPAYLYMAEASVVVGRDGIPDPTYNHARNP